MSSAEEDRWRAAWLRGGRISEVAWIGQDVLAWCSGLHLVFLDVPSNKLRMPRFPNDVVAAGASCLSGHWSRRVFAFAEKNLKPRILIHAYPSMTRICECVKGTSHAYLSTAFAGDYLMSLGSLPDFKLIVWSWRSGDKIASVDTTIHDAGNYGQTLRVNFFTPMFIAQIGNTTGRLCTWQMTACGNSTGTSIGTAILDKNELSLPRKALVKDAAWCPDSSDVLAIVDRDGHIYLCRPNGSELRRVVLSQRCGVCVEIEPAAICWHRAGIVLRTTFCQIRYYREAERGAWRKVWYAKSTNYPCALTSHPFRNDRLFYATKEGHLVKINFTDDALDAVLDVKQFIGGRYRFVDFVRPWDEHVVVIDASMELAVIRACEGAQVASVNLDMKGNVTCMISHPDYPLIVVCSDKGEVVFVSLFHYYSPEILGRYRMQSEALDLMKFSSSGRHLAVCQKEHGICYLYSVSYTQPINVITKLDADLMIVDILLFDVQNGLKFYVLQCYSNIASIGYKLLLYDLSSSHPEFKKAPTEFCFENNFRYLCYAPGESNIFVGTPYLTKQLRFFKFNNWEDVTCFDVKSTGHNVREVKIFTNKKWLITSSLDGSIIIRNASAKSNKNVHLLTHHKCDFGVTKTTVNFSGDLLIALGTDGSLVAIRYYGSEKMPLIDDRFKNLFEFGHTNFKDHEDKIAEYTKTTDKKLIEFLSEPVHSFMHDEESEDMTWVEWKERTKIEEENKLSASEKEKIVSILNTMKNKVTDLLNKNETCSEAERLSISEFDLDKIFREKCMKAAKDEREEVRQELDSNCSEMERIADWIQKEFWKPQKVFAQSIFGIFDETEVTNYTICAEAIGRSDLFDFAQFARNVANDLTTHDAIYPWETYTSSELNLMFDKQLQVKKTDEIEKIDNLINNEEDEVDVEEELNRQLLEGMTTHRFIEPCAPYYSQFMIYAFSQILSDNRNIAEDCKRLRLYFNKQFDEVYSIKEREMNLVRERIDRILYISYELRVMFQEIVEDTFAYPEWDLKEKPETIVQVTDAEVSTRLYISPSQQELLDKQAAEEERQRLAQLADDFRERALDTMMDGVLEFRWEDLIKRDVARPECMLLGKNSADYTDEDILAVKRYEEEVRNLESERARYRKILQTDYAKINGALREAIEKFNSRLEEFHLFKMKVESAIQQLDLRFVRYLVRHVKRVNELKVDDNIKMKIEEGYRSISTISENMKIIQSLELELHNQYETLNSKDKYMEKKLKNEFSTLGKNAFASITVQYKRRPRTVLKTTSSAEVLDLGKCIISMNKLPYLTSECLDFLKQLEMLDIRPAALPQSIDATNWENLVALRRLKIDQELRLRAASLDLDEASAGLENYSRAQTEHRLAVEAFKEQREKSRRARAERELDAELQLVVKMGQTEVENTRGSVHEDAARAIVVTRAEIEEVNRAILENGRKKIRAIERSLEFRRGIKGEEWDHECLGTRVRHLGVQLYYARTANVTREIREFLRRRGKGLKEDKTTVKMEREFEATRNNQEKVLKEWKMKLENVSKEVMRVQRKNEKLDEKVTNMNVDRCDMELKRDIEGEIRQKDYQDRVLKLNAERSAVMRKLLQNYENLLEVRKKRDDLARMCGLPVKFVPDIEKE